MDEVSEVDLSWIEFYSTFADALLLYKESREDLLIKLQDVFKSIGLKFPKLEADSVAVDIDPFTIYGFFNKGITDENRKKIVQALITEFDLRVAAPTGFTGIPVLNNLSAAFFAFKDRRGEDDISNLWAMFESALAYAEDASSVNRRIFVKVFDTVKVQAQVKWNLTMALYWIRPRSFINLDSRNRQFMADERHLSLSTTEVSLKHDVVPSGEEYLCLVDACQKALDGGDYPYKSFPELSFYVWVASERVNQEKLSDEKSQIRPLISAACTRWFAPLLKALKDLGGFATPQQACERIAENESLSEDILNETRGKTNQNKFHNDVMWARYYLVEKGYIGKAKRGIWNLTESGKTVVMTDELASEIFRTVVSNNQAKRNRSGAALADEGVTQIHYWLYSPGDDACMWDDFYHKGIMAIGWSDIGDLKEYSSKEQMKQAMQEYIDAELSFKNLIPTCSE